MMMMMMQPTPLALAPTALRDSPLHRRAVISPHSLEYSHHLAPSPFGPAGAPSSVYIDPKSRAIVTASTGTAATTSSSTAAAVTRPDPNGKGVAYSTPATSGSENGFCALAATSPKPTQSRCCNEASDATTSKPDHSAPHRRVAATTRDAVIRSPRRRNKELPETGATPATTPRCYAVDPGTNSLRRTVINISPTQLTDFSNTVNSGSERPVRRYKVESNNHSPGEDRNGLTCRRLTPTTPDGGQPGKLSSSHKISPKPPCEKGHTRKTSISPQRNDSGRLAPGENLVSSGCKQRGVAGSLNGPSRCSHQSRNTIRRPPTSQTMGPASPITSHSQGSNRLADSVPSEAGVGASKPLYGPSVSVAGRDTLAPFDSFGPPGPSTSTEGSKQLLERASARLPGSSVEPSSDYNSRPPVPQPSMDMLQRIVANFEALLVSERSLRTAHLHSKTLELESLDHQSKIAEGIGRSDMVAPVSISPTPQAQFELHEELACLRRLCRAKDEEIRYLGDITASEGKLRRQLLDAIESFGGSGILTRPTNSEPSSQFENAEVERLRRGLLWRESQLQQAEIIAETRQQQYQQLLGELAIKEALLAAAVAKSGSSIEASPGKPSVDSSALAEGTKTAMQLQYLESEVAGMRKFINDLLFQNEELQSVIVHKDKVLNSMAKAGSESSAVHLGLEAINMVQDATTLKQQVRALEYELAKEVETSADLRSRLQSCQAQLADKRDEAVSLIESLALREVEIARLEGALQQVEREYTGLETNSRNTINGERARTANVEMELKINNEQQARLRDELAARDATILNWKSETLRQTKIRSDAEERIVVLVNELSEAHRHLQTLINQNYFKEQQLIELEKRLKQIDSRRQTSYLMEISKHRRLHLDMQLQNDEARQLADSKDERIRRLNEDLLAKCRQVESVRAVFSQDNPRDGEAVLRVAPRSAGAVASLPAAPSRKASSSSGGSSSASRAVSSSRQPSDKVDPSRDASGRSAAATLIYGPAGAKEPKSQQQAVLPREKTPPKPHGAVYRSAPARRRRSTQGTGATEARAGVVSPLQPATENLPPPRNSYRDSLLDHQVHVTGPIPNRMQTAPIQQPCS